MKGLLIFISGILLIIFTLCESNIKSKKDNEYIVKPFCDASGSGFQVLDINEGTKINVGAVKQMNGNLYMPFYSSYPEFNRKVVDGYFVNDTNYYFEIVGDIFVVIEHKRDIKTSY